MKPLTEKNLPDGKILACGGISGRMELYLYTITFMPAIRKKDASKQGKRNPDLLSHKKVMRETYEASRLEGKVQNLGIKNLGRQKKKPTQPE